MGRVQVGRSRTDGMIEQVTLTILAITKGIWVMEVGDEYPDAKVVGIDISCIQPIFVPANVHFIIDDYNDEWGHEGIYDLIHARELLGTCPDWPALYRQAFK